MLFIRLLTCLLLGGTAGLAAQPVDADIARMLDGFDFGQPAGQPPVSSMVVEGSVETVRGQFMEAGRPEYLVRLMLEGNNQRQRFAFIAYAVADKAWLASDWYAYGYTHMEPVDLDGDGISELRHEIDMPGNRMDQQRCRLVSVRGGEGDEIYRIDGFRINEEFLDRATEGDHIASKFTLKVEDTDGDGQPEIIETVTDHYFNYEDNNLNRDYDPYAQRILPGLKQKTTVYQWRKGKLDVLQVY